LIADEIVAERFASFDFRFAGMGWCGRAEFISLDSLGMGEREFMF
jgi:hypothetical protein